MIQSVSPGDWRATRCGRASCCGLAARSGDVDDALPVAAASTLSTAFSCCTRSRQRHVLKRCKMGARPEPQRRRRALRAGIPNARQRRTESATPPRDGARGRRIVLEAIEGNHAALTRAALEAGAFLAGAAEPVVRAFARAGDLLSKEPPPLRRRCSRTCRRRRDRLQRSSTLHCATNGVSTKRRRVRRITCASTSSATSERKASTPASARTGSHRALPGSISSVWTRRPSCSGIDCAHRF